MMIFIRKVLSYIIRHCLTFLPEKSYLNILYFIEVGEFLHIKEPRTFTEKIQWLKIYDFKPEYTKLVDKLTVKEYVSAIIGTEYIIPTIGVWNNVSDINWDSLPEQFVLKTTHGGGGYGVVICNNKATFDKEKAIKKLTLSMKTNAGHSYREKPYLAVPRRIIAEKYMAEKDAEGKLINKDLSDYKFFCFNGEPKYCQVIRDRHTKETIDFYDMDWNHAPFIGLNFMAKNGMKPVSRPIHLEIMKNICRKLSKDMKFVRIDLYVINEQVYFGEITLYPASGFGNFSPKGWNEKLGKLIKINI